MKLQLSKELQNKLRADGTFYQVKDYIFQKTFFKTIINYIIDWRYKGVSKNLQEWLLANSDAPNGVKNELKDLKNLKKNDSLMRQLLAFVNRNITYVPDATTWKVEEKWQTPEETWSSMNGDCEDGAILLYSIAKWIGFDESRLRIVCGEVVGGGHAYLLYTADDGNDYPMDWCYWYEKSKSMKESYDERSDYYYGAREWFRFNALDSWRKLE